MIDPAAIRKFRPPSETGEPADVCLILEGTYPYVRGGVSTWVHQVISAMPETCFCIVFIGANKATNPYAQYNMPKNVASLSEIYLFDPPSPEDPDFAMPSAAAERIASARGKDAFDDLIVKLRDLFELTPTPDPEVTLTDALLALSRVSHTHNLQQVWRDRRVWDFLTDLYSRHYPEEGYLDFYYNARFILEPVWKLVQALPALPPAHVYHSVCTGYAGLLAGLAREVHGGAFLLSEHGIYVRERIADLQRSEWMPQTWTLDSWRAGRNWIRECWIDFFIALGRQAYDSADRIVSLFERNADVQVEYGAPREKISIIPNGISPSRFDPVAKARRERREAMPDRKVVGFFGRLVAIKDLKTLFRAARIVLNEIPDALFSITGPTEEEPEYFASCKALIERLGIQDRVVFPGVKNPENALPDFDVVALSSASEGLPFVVLEALAAGIPVVSTRVGACGELIEGRPGEGDGPEGQPAGFVVDTGSPEALAHALITLLRDRGLQDRLGENGRRRVQRAYHEEGVVDEYARLYRAYSSTSHVS